MEETGKIYIVGTSNAIEKIWAYIRDESGLKLKSPRDGGDYWIVDFSPNITEDTEVD